MGAAEDYTQHWDTMFRSRDWGRWPVDDLVRFMGRNFKTANKPGTKVLEIGCGPGANTWFLQREGFAVSAIDVSPAAIELTRERLQRENPGIAAPDVELKVGNFEQLPWPDNHFDVVVDIVALYANTTAVIARVLAEISRVLKPGGKFYSKLWGTNTTGFGMGTQIEPGTFDNIPSGPFLHMGVTHFFTREEIRQVFGQFFTPVTIDMVCRSDMAANQMFEEFHCQFTKEK